MSFSAIPQATEGGQPPRVRIDIGTDDPAKPFLSLTVLRDGKPIREQPYVGGSEAVAFDYEAPFGVPVTYSVVGTVATATSIYNETWGSLAGWSTISGSPELTGSRLSNGYVSRSLGFPASGRIEGRGLPMSNAPGSALTFGPLALRNDTLSYAGSVAYGSGPATVIQTLGAPFTITWDSDSATVTTLGGTWDIQRSDGAYPDTLVAGATGPVGSSNFVEDFQIFSTEGAPFTSSATTTASFAGTWLIHPTKPSLSCQIDGDDVPDLFIDASSGETKAAAAQATILRGIGRKKAVVITSGPRQADEWTLVIGAETLAAKNAIRALVDDQTPLLLRSAPDFSIDLPDDWYSVGDFAASRPEAPIVSQASTLTLPLTPVDEPIVRQGALWTWGDVLMKYATWQDVLDDNATWLDVLAGE